MTVAEPKVRTKRVLARVAAALWVVPTEDLSPAEMVARARSFIDVLHGDPRITAEELPDYLVPDYCGVMRHYPRADVNSHDILLGRDAINVLELSTAIEFTVRVRIADQPVIGDVEDVPTDVYRCAWDGVTLVVGWKQDGDTIPLSGGQVVVDVLAELLRHAGDSLYVQACTPGCENRFLHQTLVTAPEDGADVALRQTQERRIEAKVPFGDIEPAVWFIHSAVNSTVSAFATAKGVAQRMRDLEGVARDNLTHILGHYSNHASLIAQPLRKSIRGRWQEKRWRRESQLLMTNVWLALSAIETLKGKWEEERAQVELDQDVAVIVESDLRADDKAIAVMDLSRVASATEYLASRIDNRAVVLATGVGALGGALAGAAVSGLFTLLH